ncbi:MAG TPA: hypothetical protein PKW18_04240 [Candidatus Sumerlaeota bacterium]|nr:hypothetical protein [Candidatus Sumerlaeota bacterium]HPL73765.1 hypothetical protein [Candidatus Sumerlaeota bacterium]HQH11841.1 hypothetical protein [Candidatus Sumerlaeota bacterium]
MIKSFRGVLIAGFYYCFRFRMTGGPWKYGDLDGSDNEFSPDEAGVLNATTALTPTPSYTTKLLTRFSKARSPIWGS